MTPNGNTNETITVPKTVFDLTAFDDVKLSKTVPKPAKPATLEDALAVSGNDKQRFLDMFYDGLVEHTRETARANMDGFRVITEDGDEGELYNGKYADDEKGKLINAAILSLAKMQGYEKSLSKEKKRELKDKATSFLRQNPAMLESIQG